MDLVGMAEDEPPPSEPALRRCVTDLDCEQGREFCHPERLVCVKIECVDDRECDPGNCCDPIYYYCRACVCRQDLDCDDHQYCDPGLGTCRDGCRDTTCGHNQYCYHAETPRRCHDRGCASDDDCRSPDTYCSREPVDPPQFDPAPEEGGEPVPVMEGSCKRGCRLGEADACDAERRCDPDRHDCLPIDCRADEECEPISGNAKGECDPEEEVCAQPAYCDRGQRLCRLGCLPVLWGEDEVPCLEPEEEYCSVDLPVRTCRPRFCIRDTDCSRVDHYCAALPGDVNGQCQPGCRTGGCPDPSRQACDLESRTCVVYGCDVDDDCDDCDALATCEGEPPHYCYRATRECLPGCRDDYDCAEGRSCDQLTRECVGDPCPGGDGDCLPEEYCASTGGATRVCKPGCRVADADACPPLMPCRPSDRVCGCREGAFDCQQGEACQDGKCVIPCEDETPCRALGLVCSPRIGFCVEGCADDLREPDDLPEDATAFEELATPLDEALVVCDSDADWFSVNLVARQSLTARIRFSQPAGNLDLALFSPLESPDEDWLDYCVERPDGRPRCSRGRAGVEELVIPGAPVAGTWLLAVQRFDHRGHVAEVPRVPYRLTLDRGEPPLPCEEDVLGGGVPGSNDTRAEAVAVEPGAWELLTLCDAHADWYSLVLQDGDAVEASIRFDHVLANLDLALYHEAGDMPLSASTCDALRCPDPSREEVSVGPIPEGWGGTYLVEVRAAGAWATTSYGLEIGVVPAAP